MMSLKIECPGCAQNMGIEREDAEATERGTSLGRLVSPQFDDPNLRPKFCNRACQTQIVFPGLGPFSARPIRKKCK